MSNNISLRARETAKGETPLVQAHFKCFQDLYCVEKNPTGYINLGTAENFLIDGLVQERLNRCTPVQKKDLHYTLPSGLPILKNALHHFFDRYLHINTISADNFVIGSGASGILEMLSFTLFDEGDTVLLMAPYYTGFQHDLELRFKANLKTSVCFENNRVNFEILRSDILKHKCKAIVINQPHNPTGHVFNESEIKGVIELAKEFNLKIISDEIYALSTFGAPHLSFLNSRFDHLQYRDQIFVVYGMAKDFALSGLKCGVLYSENKEALKVLQGLAYFHTVSNLTQKMMAEIISDTDFIDSLIQINQKELHRAFSLLESELKKIGVTVYPAGGGIFAWADFSKVTKIHSHQDELAFFDRLLNEAKINITPGQFFFNHRSGEFRICYAQQFDIIKLAIERIAKII